MEVDITKCIIDLKKFKVIKKNKWKGSSGSVSIIADKSTNTQYIAKVLKKSLNEGYKAQINFFNSIKIHNIIRGYPNIVNFYGFNMTNILSKETAINPTLIFEYVKNGTLSQYLNGDNPIQKNRLSNTKKQICIIGVAIAIEIIHQNGIAHLDIKPNNILLDENLYPKVTDFGSAHFLSESHSSDEKSCIFSSDMSAPLYSSPEVIKLSSFSPKSDVYSYGYLLYSIVSGYEPMLESSNIMDLFKSILKGKRPDLSLIQKKQNAGQNPMNNYFGCTGFAKLISECWDANPDNRPTFSEIIDRLLGDPDLLLSGVDQEEVNAYLQRFDSVKIGPNRANSGQNFRIRTHYSAPKADAINKFDIPNFGELNELCKQLVDAAADSLDIESCATVGYNLANGFNGFPKCVDQAIKYLRIAIDDENPSAMNTYATILWEQASSASLPENIREKQKSAAKRLYKSAADLGNTFAMISYSTILVNECKCGEKEETKNANLLFSSSASLTSSFPKAEIAAKRIDDFEEENENCQKIGNNNNEKSGNELGSDFSDVETENYNDISDETDSADGGKVLSKEAKWKEAMDYMKMAVDNDNIIAFKLYCEIFANGENKTVDEYTKSTYAPSKK